MGGHGGGHGGYFRHGRFWGGSGYFVGSSCYRTVWTNVGPQRVNVCEDIFLTPAKNARRVEPAGCI